jgi:hypothetical protein
MNVSRIGFASLVISITAGCAATAQSSGPSGSSGGTGSGSGAQSSGTSGSSGAEASGASGTSGSSGAEASGASGSSGAQSSGTSGSSGSAASGVSGGSGAMTSGASGASSGVVSGSASGAPADAGTAQHEGGDGAVAQGCANMPLCDDFESDTAGGPPSSALWSTFTGTYSSDSISVDTSQAHSGTKSVKVVSAGMDAWGPLFTNTTAFSTLKSVVYGRFWVYANAALPSTHHAFMTLALSAAAAMPSAQIKGIEATGQSPSGPGLLTWNLNDSLLPDVYNFKSVTLPAATWSCFEFHTDASSGNIEAWMNGVRLDTMSLPNDAGAKWTSASPPTPLQIYGLGLGWMAFNGSPMTLWFDDAALGASRIGCQ